MMTTIYGNNPDSPVSVDLAVEADALFDVLSSARRRFILACLGESAASKPLRDIAYQLATWECGTEITEIPSDDVTSVYGSLYHVHVPKMADVGLVEYDEERDAVTLVENSDAVTSVMEIPTTGL